MGLSFVFLQQEMPCSHPKDALRLPPKGVTRFTLQIGRAEADTASATHSKVHGDQQALLEYEPQFDLVEGRARAADFSKAPGRQVMNKVSVFTLKVHHNGLLVGVVSAIGLSV
jgi:hypothetical protein